ncbi:MAG: TrbC/VirB2 family protein [Candidatus Pacebacteria bacterium]|nr:TrbC/VirB2 family protein [Candidatus Paceibacterota bacterium]MDD5721891.1 TrbC/VirB2 family protein [Candidatus Paceibacterota bacterium]
MKNLIFIISLLTIFLIALPVLGQDLVFKNPFKEITTITSLIEAIIKFLKSLAIMVSAILIVYAGYLYMTSAGNQQKIETAQKTLIWALVGIGVILIASAITKVIENVLEVDLTIGSNTISEVNKVDK